MQKSIKKSIIIIVALLIISSANAIFASPFVSSISGRNASTGRVKSEILYRRFIFDPSTKLEDANAIEGRLHFKIGMASYFLVSSYSKFDTKLKDTTTNINIKSYALGLGEQHNSGGTTGFSYYLFYGIDQFDGDLGAHKVRYIEPEISFDLGLFSKAGAFAKGPSPAHLRIGASVKISRNVEFLTDKTKMYTKSGFVGFSFILPF